MRHRTAILALLLVLLLLAGCAEPYYGVIKANQIERVSVINLETGAIKAVEHEQFAALTRGYNNCTIVSDEVGTTHPLRVDILMADGKEITIWGGVGDFLPSK